MSIVVDAAEARYIKGLTRQIEQFYQKSTFIPAPSVINLYDTDCIKHIADDILLFGKNTKELHSKIIALL